MCLSQGSSKSRAARQAKRKAARAKKQQNEAQPQNKTPPPESPPSSASDSPGEQRSRRSLRLGNAVVVDFKALSSRGRDYLAQSSSETRSSDGPCDFVVKQTFASYDELMRFTKQYEKDHHVRLNASMITPDDRPMGMGDWDYYRFVTLWCNFDPHMRVPNAGYTPIGQRYCPFYVRVAGDVTHKCLVVQAVSQKVHEHAVEAPSQLLAAPPLPVQLEGQNLSQDPASVAGSRRGRNETRAKTPRRKLGRVVKPRKRVRQRKRPPLVALEPQEAQEVQEVQEAAQGNKQEPSPAKSPKKSPRAKAGPVEKPKCALCDFLCHSTEELVGHTWLRHQILTETWDLQ